MSKESKLPKIEKGVPIPLKSGKTGIGEFLQKMSVGDSFVCNRISQNGMTGNAKSAGVKITTRKISDTEIRVWRIE